MSLLLDVYPDGAYETIEWDYANERAVVQYFSPDLQPALDRCAELRNHGNDRIQTHEGLDIRHVAHVPPSIQMEWFTKYGVRAWDKDHLPAIRRLLDGEYSRFRTSKLRL